MVRIDGDELNNEKKKNEQKVMIKNMLALVYS